MRVGIGSGSQPSSVFPLVVTPAILNTSSIIIILNIIFFFLKDKVKIEDIISKTFIINSSPHHFYNIYNIFS